MKNSGLYDQGFVIHFDEGDIALYRNFIIYKSSIHDKYHIIQQGESLHSIARKYYGTSSLWFAIADVNEVIPDIFNLPLGQTILIPNIIN